MGKFLPDWQPICLTEFKTRKQIKGVNEVLNSNNLINFIIICHGVPILV